MSALAKAGGWTVRPRRTSLVGGAKTGESVEVVAF